MMMMARICFHNSDAELGIAALRNDGFTVLSHVFPEEPDHVFVEASRDEVSDTLSEDELACGMLYEVIDITNGAADDAGPIPAGHRPFEYETAVWNPPAADDLNNEIPF